MEEYERIARRQYKKMNERSPVPKGFESQMFEKLKANAYETYVTPFEDMVSRQGSVRPETLQTLLNAKKEDTKRREETAAMRGMDEPAISGLGETDELKQAKVNAKLESMGVVIDRETPVQSWQVGLAETPEAGLQRLLSGHYKQQIPVKVIEGEYIYKDPSDGRLVKADIGGVAGFLAATPDIADVGATVAMPAKSLLTSPIKKEMGISGAASGVTEMVRLSAGNILGANNLDSDEIIKMSAKKGGINSLLTGVGGAAYKMLKGVKNFWTGGVFTHEEAVRHGIATEYAEEVVESANRISRQVADGGDFKPTSYQKTAAQGAGDVNLGAMEADVRKRGEFAQRFADIDAANRQSMGKTIEGMHKPEILPLVDKGDITDVAARKMAGVTRKMEGIVQPGIEKRTVGIAQDTGLPYEQVGDTTKEFITKADAVAKGKEKAEWKKVKDVGGYDVANNKFGIDIPEGKLTKKLKREYAEQSRESITQVGKKASGDIFVGGQKQPVSKPETQIQKIMARVHKSLDEKKIKKGDLEYVNAEISGLKAELRSKSTNQAFTDSQKRKVQNVIDAIESDRNLYLVKSGRGDLITQIQKAEKETEKYHEVFDTSKVGDLLSVNKNGVPKIKTDEYVDSVLKGDVVEAQQLKRVIDKDPEMALAFRKGISNKYKRIAYGEKDKFNRKKSDDFFNNPVVSEFFTKAEIVGFKRRGDFALKIEKQIEKLASFKKTAKARFGTAALAKTDSRSLVKNITGDSTLFTLGAKERKDAVTKIKYLKNMYADHPQAWSQFKNDYNKKVSESLMDSDGLVKSSKLDNLVNDSKLMEIAAEINGKNYVKNLKTMNEMNKILNNKAKTLMADERMQVIVQAMRGAYFAPLSRRGRVFSAYLTWDSNATKRVMADALLDDSVMAKIAELSKSKKWSREFFEKSAVLGLYGSTKEAYDSAKEHELLTGEGLAK